MLGKRLDKGKLNKKQLILGDRKLNNMKNKRKKRINIYIVIGLMFIASALAFAYYNMWDEARAEKDVKSALAKLKKVQPKVVQQEAEEYENPEEVEIPDYQLDDSREMPISFIDGMSYVGSLSIPSLELELPILDSWDYNKLKLSPCTYSGSPYKDNFIVLAHNYNAHFGSIQFLNEGDDIFFTDMEGNLFKYKVTQKDTLDMTQVKEMNEGDWDLTLFTCSLNSSERITVRCKKTDSD